MANDAASGQLFFMGSSTLVKADLGLKRVCPSCGARFYDLQKRPIECPKCAYAFEPEALYKQRRPRQPEPAVAEPATAESDDEESEDEENEEAEAETETVEPVENEAPITTASDDEEEEETQSEEAEAEDAGMSVVEDEDTDLEDLGEEDVEDEDDDTLLEEVEEDADYVSGIIDADIEKDER